MGAAEERYYKGVRDDVHVIRNRIVSMDESLKRIADALTAMASKERITDGNETELPNLLQHIVGVPDMEEKMRQVQMIKDFHITCEDNIPEDKGL